MLITLVSSDGISFKVDSETLPSTLIQKWLKPVKTVAPINPFKSNGITFGKIVKWIQQKRRKFVNPATPRKHLNVNGSTLRKIVEWIQHHKADLVNGDYTLRVPTHGQGVPNWDKHFLRKLDVNSLLYVLMAAYELEMEVLIRYGCATVASHMRGKSVEEVREMFGIVSDFTPEEEEQMRKECAWAYN